jgi:hypothetical protein
VRRLLTLGLPSSLSDARSWLDVASQRGPPCGRERNGESSRQGRGRKKPTDSDSLDSILSQRNSPLD